MQSAPTTRCPACGGEVHAIAGRCKHCKHDLVQFRAQQALAVQPLPQQQRPVNGTPPAGMAPAQMPAPPPQPAPLQHHPHPPVPLRRRWPLWIGGAALFLLGLSAGVMVERWRAPEAEAAGAEAPQTSSPELLPESIPTDPLIPGAPTPTPTPTDPTPKSPGGVSDVTAFIDRFGALFCDKAIECGLFDASNRRLCVSAVAQSRDPDARAKLSSGDCTFDPAAAQRCLASIESASCDPSVGNNQMATLLATSMVECERAYSCE